MVKHKQNVRTTNRTVLTLAVCFRQSAVIKNKELDLLILTVILNDINQKTHADPHVS